MRRPADRCGPRRRHHRSHQQPRARRLLPAPPRRSPAPTHQTSREIHHIPVISKALREYICHIARDQVCLVFPQPHAEACVAVTWAAAADECVTGGESAGACRPVHRSCAFTFDLVGRTAQRAVDMHMDGRGSDTHSKGRDGDTHMDHRRPELRRPVSPAAEI